MTIQTYPSKTANAVVTYSFDFTPSLNLVGSDDFVTSVNVSASSAVQILVTSVVGNAAIALIGGGTPGTSESIEWTAQTNSGLTFDEFCLLPIEATPASVWSPPARMYLTSPSDDSTPQSSIVYSTTSVLKTARFVLQRADILALYLNPLQLVAPPGVGFVTVLQSLSYSLNYVAGQYLGLVIVFYGSNSTTGVAADGSDNGVIGTTFGSVVYFSPPDTVAGNEWQRGNLENQPLTLLSQAPITGDGTSVLTINISYMTIAL